MSKDHKTKLMTNVFNVMYQTSLSRGSSPDVAYNKSVDYLLSRYSDYS